MLFRLHGGSVRAGAWKGNAGIVDERESRGMFPALRGTMLPMDFAEIYHFLFETYAGIGVLVGVSLVLCIIIAAVLELRTRKTYVDRGPSDDEDEWSFFDDDDEDDEEESGSSK